MASLPELIRAVIQQSRQSSPRAASVQTVEIRSTWGGEIVVKFKNGRQQHIHISQTAGLYRLSSAILKRGQVEAIGRAKILPFIWQRNRETQLVAFSLDQRGHLQGTIEQPAATMDAQEMHFYLERLAYECDQLEYLLSGTENF